MTLALPLVIPWNVIGTIWIIFTRPDIGLFGVGINSLHRSGTEPFDHTAKPLLRLDNIDGHGDLALDPVGGVALAYAGLRAIPEAYYQAAKIDGATSWATFSCISNCPKCVAC